MIRRVLFQTFLGLIVFLFIAGCTTQTPALELTINENECSFEGPKAIANSEFKINLTINEKKPSESGYALITLANGKTIDDLKAWPSADQPSWVVLIHGVHELTAGVHTYTYDPARFTENAAYKGGPLYLVCFRADSDSGIIKKIGSFGPIEFND